MDFFLHRRYYSLQHLKMSSKKDIVASGSSGQDGSGGRKNPNLVRPHPSKPTEVLNEWEFGDHFCFPNDISVQLVESSIVSTEKSEDNAMYFTKEQFNAALRFPLLFFFKQFLHYTKIPSILLHLNMVRVLMGVQHSGHAVSLGSFLAGGSLCLYHQEGKKRCFQPVRQHLLPSVRDGPPEFNQGKNQRICASQGCMGRLIRPPR